MLASLYSPFGPFFPSAEETQAPSNTANELLKKQLSEMLTMNEYMSSLYKLFRFQPDVERAVLKSVLTDILVSKLTDSMANKIVHSGPLDNLISFSTDCRHNYAPCPLTLTFLECLRDAAKQIDFHPRHLISLQLRNVDIDDQCLYVIVEMVKDRKVAFIDLRMNPKLSDTALSKLVDAMIPTKEAYFLDVRDIPFGQAGIDKLDELANASHGPDALKHVYGPEAPVATERSDFFEM